MDSRAKELIKRSDKLFAARLGVLSLWQELADNFFPERADFTIKRIAMVGFADHLFATDPVLMRRDLGNAFASMLRPRGSPWFKRDVEDDALREAPGVADWLDQTTTMMRRLMYARTAQFTRATKEADHDFAAFGNAVLSCEVNAGMTGLRFRDYHLRDCAWAEDADGEVDTLFRDIGNFTARQMEQYFSDPGDSLHEQVKKALEKDPDKVFRIRHCHLPSKDYDYTQGDKAKGRAQMPYASVYIDMDNQHLVRSAGAHEFRYVVPRWQTISSSPYAVSPAAIVALPDARMMQALSRIIQEAGEKSIDPPLKATEEAVKGEINMYAAGITWVDREYDEKMGPAIEPIRLGEDAKLGVNLFDRIQAVLQNAWYLNKLVLPDTRARTAFETAQLMEESIRASIPLFEPVETEYNARVLDLSDRIVIRMGGYGRKDDLPEAMNGKEVVFTFSNPLQEAIEKQKVLQFQTVAGIFGAAAQFDPATVAQFDAVEAARDAARGSGAPAAWLKDKDQAAEEMQAAKNQQQMAGILNAADAGGQAIQGLGRGVEALSRANANTTPGSLPQAA